MVHLPWTTVDVPQGPALVMASEFHLTQVRRTPSFLLDALRIRRRVMAADGALGVALEARPLRRTFRTVSAWRDRAALDAFVRAEPHRTTMVRHRTGMAASRFVFWTTDDLPVRWPDAVRRLAADDAPDVPASGAAS